MSDEEKLTPDQELARKGLEDPVFFCRHFLNHLFPTEMPWVHRGLLAILTRRTKFLTKYGDLDKIQRNFTFKRDGKTYPIFLRRNNDLVLLKTKYTLVMMPRGFSKTTLVSVAVPIYDTVYANVKFTACVSETAGHANMQLNNVKRELESNAEIVRVFGNLKPAMKDPQKWTEGFFETTTGIAFVARGRGGQVRGLNHNGLRPSKILCDDLEDKESVATEEQRKKVRSWAYGDLMPALPALDPDATIIAVGTLLHDDALLRTFMRDPKWTCVVFGVYDKDGELLWPANMDDKKIEETKESFILAGEVKSFYMEYYSELRNDTSAKFKEEYFIYNDRPREFFNAIFCDPAISKRKRADKAAIGVVGVSPGGTFRVQETWSQRGAEPSEIIDKYFELHKRWGCLKAGFESNAWQAALGYMLRERMAKENYYFECEGKFSSNSNEERINALLQPRYAARAMEHRSREPQLEAELLDFPDAKHDDNATAVAGAVGLLAPFAGLSGVEDEPSEDQDESEPIRCNAAP